jgi:oxygen-dependent protoporphyrinogen oxidase
VRLQANVQGIERLPTGWRVHLQDQPACAADGLCLALPAPQAGHLLKPIDPTLADTLQIPYASSAIVNVAYRRTDVAHPLNGMGFVVPAVEKRGLIACTFSSVKFATRAPESQVLLRAFVGGALQQAQYARTDEEIQHAVCQELRQLLGITGEPICIDMRRHPQSMPQYHVGHVQRVARMESLLQRWPGLSVAGNAYHGVGIPDCIDSGSHAAQALLSSLFALMAPQSSADEPAEHVER